MASTAPLRILGAPGVVCEGDVCEVPTHPEQALVKELLDSGEI